jgi:hypothetical protein
VPIRSALSVFLGGIRFPDRPAQNKKREADENKNKQNSTQHGLPSQHNLKDKSRADIGQQQQAKPNQGKPSGQAASPPPTHSSEKKNSHHRPGEESEDGFMVKPKRSISSL